MRMRKNFYSHIHRFMRQFLADFGAAIAKTDFSDADQTAQLKNKFADFIKLLDMHAQYEDKTYHPLIQKNEPEICQQMEREHQVLDEQLKELGETFNFALAEGIAEEEQHTRGEKFYLDYTAYLVEYFKHLLHEERLAMPALQKHYTDNELRGISLNTYSQMSPAQMIEMLKGLYPHINRYQKQVFLDDIHAGFPEKFAQVFPEILKEISNPKEKLLLSQRYSQTN